MIYIIWNFGDRLRKFFICFSIIFFIVFYYGAEDALNVVKDETRSKNEILQKEIEAKMLSQRINNLNNIEPIYQDVDEYNKYPCQGKILKGAYNKKACRMFNFIMFNNAYNDIKTDIDQLHDLGFDCDFDYVKAKDVFKYNQYLGLYYHDSLISDLNYHYPNTNHIIQNNKDNFTLLDALNDGVPIMLWMVPKKTGSIKDGHLIMVYKYDEKNHEFYFYDTFNKQLSRELTDFLQRWVIAELHIYKK